MKKNAESEYLLGTNRAELERLRFQQQVWGPVTARFFDRLGVRRGWNCLDVGAGPGLVSAELRKRVGDEGRVTALEPSQFFLDVCRSEARAQGWTNVDFIHGIAEEAAIRPALYDLIFARWVIAFVPDPDRFLRRLLPSLKPGGIIAMQDYWYEGLSLYPRGGAFDGMPDVVRAYYRSEGGDAYVTGRALEILRREGLRIIDLAPNQLAGGPESGVAEWMHRFFVPHIPLMVDKGVLSSSEAQRVLEDWHAHRQNPNALFFSPIVVDFAGERPV